MGKALGAKSDDHVRGHRVEEECSLILFDARGRMPSHGSESAPRPHLKLIYRS